MSAWDVNIITAFGRGESLALALQENGFKVRLLDFTDAFSEKYRRGVGPFPVVKESFMSAQRSYLDEVKVLPRGLVFWLPEGPVELSGPMADFYKEQFPFVEVAVTGEVHSEFREDWLRRFLVQWTSPYHVEPWRDLPRESFPAQALSGLVPAIKEGRVQTFERFQALDYEYLACRALKEVSIEPGRLREVEVDAGQTKAFAGDQWIWCLSAQETELVGGKCAETLFHGRVRKAEWVWFHLFGACERGSWTGAFPEYSIVVGDVCLPWTHGNAFVLRWLEPDIVEVWMKVPAASVLNSEQRAKWVHQAQTILSTRLPQAHWALAPEEWALCPHSPVFDVNTQDWREPAWKNWDWIAPETMSRLDWSSRLQSEARCYDRLIQWRNEQMKRQGASRDRALHPS
jgi:hypothetical protein